MIVGGALRVTVYGTNDGPEVNHELVRSATELVDVGLRPVVGVAEVDLFAQLEIDERDERIFESVRYARTEHVVEDERVVNVEAKRLTFLRTHEERRVDLYGTHAV